MSELSDALFSADPQIRAAALIDLPDADPSEVDEIFKGLRLIETDGYRWDERFRRTPFASDRRHLRRYLNVLLGYVPEACRVVRSGAGQLRRLDLGGAEGAVVPLGPRFQFGRFPKAESVRIVHAHLPDLEGLRDLPDARQLELSDVATDRPGPLVLGDAQRLELHGVDARIERVEAPRLTDLALRATALPLDRLDGLDALCSLTLQAHPLVDFSELPELPALTALSARSCADLASCGGLDRQPALTHVALGDSRSLASLEGLPASLRQIDLDGVPALRSLDGLPELPVESFTVDGAAVLVDVSRLPAAMPRVERVRLSGMRRRIDLKPLVGLEALRLLDLRDSRGVRSVDGFLGHETLRVLLLGGTPIDRSAVPPRERWRCSWAKNPNIEEMLHRTPPAAETWEALKGSGRVVLAKIRKLLRAPDVDVIDQGLELLRVVDEPHVYDALLEGSDYREVRTASRLNRRPWRLGSRRFVGPTRAYVLHRLLADAPEEATYAAALRERVHTLDFVEPRYPPRPHPLDLRSLAALPNLEALAFARFGPLTLEDEDDPGVVPQLRRLEIHHQQAPMPTAWLGAQVGLEHVSLIGEHAGSRDLAWAARLPRLRSLEINQQSQLDLSPLARSTSLRELSIWSCSGLTTLDGLPEGLESVRVSWCWQLTDLGQLLELPSLEEFRRYGCAIPDEQLVQLRERGVRILR